MVQHKSRWISRQVRFVCERLRGDDGLPFQDVLNSEMVEDVIRETAPGGRDCGYTPAVTLSTFLSQVISADHSCREAVLRLRTHQVSDGQSPCSPETSPYCKARRRLPEALPMELARRIGRELHEKPQRDASFLNGRPLVMADGSTVSMPDTPANQAEYPQHSAAKAGCGFPIARFVALICWETGAVLDVAIGAYSGKETGETALLREMYERLKTGDILVADRYYGNWWTIAMLAARGVDIITRLHQLRTCDFRRGQRLGIGDHIVTWMKPARPEWMNRETYDALPDELKVRELRVRSNDPTTRVNQITIVTTLTDDELFPKEQIAQGNHWRWDAELDLRSIKTHMQMDVLRCKSPEMVRKEIGMHLAAYNLIRTIMCESAVEYGVRPREISFKGTLQALGAFRATAVLASPHDLPVLYDDLLGMIAAHRVRNRPGRVEPRAVKRRPKPHKLLTVPRNVARKRCPET